MTAPIALLAVVLVPATLWLAERALVCIALALWHRR